jgi:hypothetical protein
MCVMASTASNTTSSCPSSPDTLVKPAKPPRGEGGREDNQPETMPRFTASSRCCFPHLQAVALPRRSADAAATVAATGRRWCLRGGGSNNGSHLPSLLVLWAVMIILEGSRCKMANGWCNVAVLPRPRGQVAAVARKSSSSPSSSVATTTTLAMSSNNEQSNQDELLERARRLREEARVMEEGLRGGGGASSRVTTTTTATPVTYTRLEDSVWTVSYRFSSQPGAPSPPDADGRRRKSNGDTTTTTPAVPRTFYSGTVTIRFRGDGYSERLDTSMEENQLEPNSDRQPTNRNNNLRISKIWGWDQETSNDGNDGRDYLLFSVDVTLPESDPDRPLQTDRFYFQARVERDRIDKRTLSLRDGTITVKRDVAETTKGRWGIFNVAGILTEFKYVGDFVAKPSPPPSSSSDPSSQRQ